MTFFPFGIPSTSSFAENVERAKNLTNTNYTAPYALVAQSAPSGSDGINATSSDCPPGYVNAYDPPDPYTAVPANPLAPNRHTYILCFETP